MKKSTLFSALFLSAFIFVFNNSAAGNSIYYDIDFSSPTHVAGQTPAVGSSPAMPSEIAFGSPIVTKDFGSMTNQPLLFNTQGNEPPFYYDQIGLNMDGGRGFYYTSFDVITQADRQQKQFHRSL